MENIEIEIQVRIENIDPLNKFLVKNARKTGELHQIDRYFTPAHKNYLEPRPIKEWLRLRDVNGKHLITYKYVNHEDDGRSHSRDEYETEVSDIKQAEHIFEALGIKEIVVVDKNRITYKYKEYEIALDSVKGLGEFVEIEYKGNGKKEDARKISNEMIQFLKDVGVGRIEKNYVGYPFIALFPNEVEWEVC